MRFEERARAHMLAGGHAPLAAYEMLRRDALLSASTHARYPPLLYALALRREDGGVTFPVAGFDGGSVSMLSVRIG